MSVTRTVRLMIVRMVALVTIAAASISGIHWTAAADRDSDVVAVGVLLEPEVAMVRYVQTANAELRRTYPDRYAGESAPCPRITLVQRFVHEADLPGMIEAIAIAVDDERATTLQLTTNGYAYGFQNPARVGVLSLNVQVSPPLRRFEQRIVDAVEPFAVRGGNADAFAVPVNMETINWVEQFVPALSGKNFVAQLPVGVVPTEYLNALRSRPFLPLTFGVTGVAIYRLGTLGAAHERIWDSDGVNPCACPFEEPDTEFEGG